MDEEQKTCFVITPIGSEGSETRKRSDQILRHVIRPAAEECGYKATRADEISLPGEITVQIINHIMDDPMIVADLTGWNPNVFYELAVRHAARRPFVLLFQPMPQRDRIPFDIRGQRAIYLDYPDWDSMVESKAKLIEAITAVEAMDAEQLKTPIAHAIDFQALTKSKDPTISLLSELDLSIRRIEHRLISLEEQRLILSPPYYKSPVPPTSTYSHTPPTATPYYSSPVPPTSTYTHIPPTPSPGYTHTPPTATPRYTPPTPAPPTSTPLRDYRSTREKESANDENDK